MSPPVPLQSLWRAVVSEVLPREVGARAQGLALALGLCFHSEGSSGEQPAGSRALG